jgi:hypothetical protein
VRLHDSPDALEGEDTGGSDALGTNAASEVESSWLSVGSRVAYPSAMFGGENKLASDSAHLNHERTAIVYSRKCGGAVALELSPHLQSLTGSVRLSS